MVTEAQIDLLVKMLDRGSVKQIETAVPGIVLSFFQALAVAWQLITKGTIVSLDTGLGKTYVAMVLTALIRGTNPKDKFIFISTKDAVMNNYKKFKKNLPNLVCDFITGEASSIQRLHWLSKDAPDVLFLTQDAIRSEEVLLWLYDRKEEYKHLMVDEIHTAIYEDAFVFQALRAIRSKMDSVLALTATPLRVSPKQFINTLHIIDEELVPNPTRMFNELAVYDDMGKLVGFDNVDEFRQIISSRYISYTRKELGLENVGGVGICTAPMTPYQEEVLCHESLTKAIARTQVRIAEDNPLLDKLMNALRFYRSEGKKGLIYANIGVIKDYLARRLREEGFKCFILDGRLDSMATKLDAQDRFNAGEFDCLIINITTSLDLQCDYIIFYELTSDFEQTIGRGQRGLTQQCVDVWFCVFLHKYDTDFFIKNVYKNGLLLKEFGGKEVREVLQGYSLVLSKIDELGVDYVEGD